MNRQGRWNDDDRRREYWNDRYEGRNQWRDQDQNRGRWEQAGDRSTYDQNRGWQGSRQRSNDYDNRQTNRYGWNQGRQQHGDEFSNRGRGNSGFYGASDYSEGRQMGYGNDRRGGYYGNAEEYSGGGVRSQSHRGFNREDDHDYDRDYARYQGRYGNEGYREEGQGRGNYARSNQQYGRGYDQDSFGQGAGYNEERHGSRYGSTNYGNERYGSDYDHERGYREGRNYEGDFGYY